MSQPESNLSRAIMNALRARGVFCFKVHGGPTMMAGLPDVIACVPVESGWSRARNAPIIIGKFVGFETKTPTGGDPTPIQHRVHNKIRAACGEVFVPRSVQDALMALRAVGWHDPTGTTPDGG